MMMNAVATAPLAAEPKTPGRSSFRYYALFFSSGFPALIYQIVWQRALFTIYGVNIQSVTAIVTVFMLGLGLGSLAGGRISGRTGINVLRIFGVIESSIGVFGAASLIIFHYVERFTAGASTASTAIITFLLLLIPTLLMGSTLPLLVEHLVRRTENVGESVGSLYCVNTLGSAVACFVASMFLMRTLGQTGSVRFAATINLLVGVTAILLSRREPGTNESPIATASSSQPARTGAISIYLGMFLSGLAGFIALAYEILWYHIYSYASGGKASCFARLLGAYLFGIAYGSLVVHDRCKRRLKSDLRETVRDASLTTGAGAIAAFLVVPATAFVVSTRIIPYDLTFVFVAIAAALLGAAFPLISHASIDPEGEAGKKLSYLYLSNIIGSALGSFLIGFVAMDHLSTAEMSRLLLLSGLVEAAALVMLAKPLIFRRSFVAIVGAGLLLAVLYRPLFAGLFERLMHRGPGQPEIVLREVVENRSGVITVDNHETVYGGGIYDGEFRIDPLDDTNNIFRAFAVAAIHPNPKRVLVVGLASGSWTQVLVNRPGVEDTQIVEINPGYLPLMRERPLVSSLLSNPKVHISIDDGRRWLISHPESKFDFILMNTTFHWRANATNLLSAEFLQIVRSHLNKGGVLYYNTTSSGRVQLTGATVFPYALRIANFIAVSDSPIVFDRENWKRILNDYEINGRPVFDLSDSRDRACIERWVSLRESVEDPHAAVPESSIEFRPSLLNRLQGHQMITDDNMGTEWW